MPASSLLTLIDDVASALDDVAVMTKVAAKKTAGVLGDDLALNAEQVSGTAADREIPVVWAVAKGSIVNKVILIPVALLISQLVPALVVPLLMLGGLFLCYEGFEKVLEKILSKLKPQAVAVVVDQAPVTEKDKIRGAVRTDFILSAEIIVITLGTVAEMPLTQQVMVLSGIGALMTVGVYGLVMLIVKIDDFGLWLIRTSPKLKFVGEALLKFAPLLMKFLGVAGTTAMFLVGGGIVKHGLLPHESDPNLLANLASDLVIGFIAGGLAVAASKVFKKIRRPKMD